MPGIRTSMITTSGLRRSARATAVAPSEASPTTRMCGARESESRRPSPGDLMGVHAQTGDLATSLPVVRHGPPNCMREIGGQSDGELELLGDHRRLRLQADAPAVPDAVLLCERADLFLQR